ncbi:CAP domain-containing protein [Orenia marismortui]|uniref:CAP domain-containing protein n=1 Tax=Orenia marismortui TaxID=46469 RepID=UPI00035E5EC7|nr:CAP domain-containing protein [Orenia marismortui]
MKKINRYFTIILVLIMGLFLTTSHANAKRRVYTVKKGDSIWNICKGCNANFLNTLRMNGHFKDPNLIYPGDKVYVPEPDRNNQTPEPQPTEPTQPTQPQNGEDMQQPPQEDMGESTNLQAMEAEVVKLVNQERQKRGLKPYKHNSKLSSVARTKSKDMRDKNYFSHQSPTYGSPFEMMTKFGIDYSTAGENIAKGQPTAKAVMNGWMNSPGHRRNILSEKFTEIGVGLAKDSKGMTYWTQMFIRP